MGSKRNEKIKGKGKAKGKVSRRKAKEKPVHRVYVTYLPDGRYYIGYSGKPEKAYERYYGSCREIMGLEDYMLLKRTLGVFERKSHAKMAEFLLQWENRHDPRCLNDMLNIRLRRRDLVGFEPIRWKPESI